MIVVVALRGPTGQVFEHHLTADDLAGARAAALELHPESVVLSTTDLADVERIRDETLAAARAARIAANEALLALHPPPDAEPTPPADAPAEPAPAPEPVDAAPAPVE